MILDTVAQAQALDRLVAGRGKAIDTVIRLKVDEAALLARVTKRFEEEGRADDNPEAFKVRLAAYAAQTAPLLPYYKAQGKLHEVDGMGSVSEVARAIDQVLGMTPA